jgi:hypothetical protein
MLSFDETADVGFFPALQASVLSEVAPRVNRYRPFGAEFLFGGEMVFPIQVFTF